MSIKKNKSTKTIITLLFCIFTLFYLSTIAYSAFSSTMNITGIAQSRVEADVRITDFSIHEVSSNAISLYEEFTKNTITSSVKFSGEELAYVIYGIEITNYSDNAVGISSVTGIPEGLTYEFTNYNLKDKICNDNNCGVLTTKTIFLKITGENLEKEFTLEFEFVSYCKITYTNITGEYPQEVISGDNLEISVPESIKHIIIEDDYIDKYTYSYNVLNVTNITNNIEIIGIGEIEHSYNYTGNNEIFIAPYDGVYRIELWGASGAEGVVKDNGTQEATGALGAYTYGVISLKKGTTLYVYVGQQGIAELNTLTYNGGTGNNGGWNGGGATDIRLTSGSWDNSASINSRIMVAAGGGTSFRQGTPGAGGGLIGYSGGGTVGGTQTTYGTPQTTGYAPSSFGIGNGGCTGGNGYYPASGATCASGSGGGSSFISGHNGCVAIASSTSTSPRNDSSGTKCTDGTTDITCSYHYSGYKFNNSLMIDGQGYYWTTSKIGQIGMPTHDGTSIMNGNLGNGYAKISYAYNSGDQVLNINYENIEGAYQKNIYKGENLIIKFTGTIPSDITVRDEENQLILYYYKNGILYVPKVTKNIKITGHSSTIYDLSGSGNNAIKVGATYTDKGLYFDGENDYVYLTNLDWKNTKAFTIEFVAKILHNDEPSMIFESSIDSNQSFGSFYIDSNEFGTNDIQLAMKYPGLHTEYTKTANHQIIDNIIDNNKFQHYIVSSDSTKAYNNFIEMYCNAIKLNTTPYEEYKADYSNQTLSNYPFYIGSRAGSAHFTPMYLKELRIYTKALTQEEITQNYNGNITTDNLLIHYKFN